MRSDVAVIVDQIDVPGILQKMWTRCQISPAFHLSLGTDPPTPNWGVSRGNLSGSQPQSRLLPSACHAPFREPLKNDLETGSKCSATSEFEHRLVEFPVVSLLDWPRKYGMKASKFTDAQQAFVIKQGEEGTPVAEFCRNAESSQAI